MRLDRQTDELYESLWLKELLAFSGISRILQKWKPVSFLDKGTFSRIFKVVHRETGEVAALKFVPNPLEAADCRTSGSPEEAFHRSRYEASKREAEIMHRFHGTSHTVQYLEEPEFLKRTFLNARGETAVQYAVLICMPLYHNHREWIPHIAQNRELRLKLGMDISKALMLFEEKGVYHRDIKPGNIMMDDQNAFCLGDVGEAKLESEFTTMGFHGTRPYMAPEVYKQENERTKMRSDHRSDIYSLGIILYRLFNHQQFPFLTGEGTLTEEAAKSYSQYEKKNRTEDSFLTDSERARLLRYDGRQLPKPNEADDALAQVILRACAYDKKDRYQTAEELYKDLKYCLENPGSSSYATTNSDRRRTGCMKMVIGGSLAAIVVIVAVTSYFLGKSAGNSAGNVTESSIVPTAFFSTIAPTAIPTATPTATPTTTPTATPTVTPTTTPTAPHTVVENISKEETVSKVSDGIYAAAAKGFMGPVAVEVTVTDNTISAIKIGDASFVEISGIGTRVLEADFQKQFIGKTLPISLNDIDVIAGATVTSRAVVDAIASAVASTDAEAESVSQSLHIAENFSCTTETGLILKFNGEGQWSITGYTGSETNLVIPDIYDGFEIAAIDRYAFSCVEPLGSKKKDAHYLESITLPPTIKTIGEGAFQAQALKTVRCAGNMDSIGDSAFQDCQKLVEFVFPETLNSLGESAFRRCENLQEAALPQGLTLVANGTFYACWKLSSVSLPEGITKIGKSAFQSTDIVSISLPESLEEIDSLAFCHSNLKTVTLPKNIKRIGEDAFYENNLVQIHFPDSQDIAIESNPFVRESGNDATTLKVVFDGYSSFKVVNGLLICSKTNTVISCLNPNIEVAVIPSSVEHIGAGAFELCKKLEEISWSDGVQSIGNSAFFSCESLQKLNMPAALLSIGENAFGHCYNLQQVHFSQRLATIGKDAFGGCDALQYIELPESVTTIGERAFVGCDNLQKVVLHEGLLRIENAAFSGCDTLQHLKLPQSVEYLGAGAFSDCNLLTSINIPKQLNEIQTNPFSSSVIRKMTIDKNHPVYQISQGILIDKRNNTAVAAVDSQVATLNIPHGVVNIGDSAFANCEELRTVILPNSVVRIGSDSFSFCENLESVLIPESVSSFGMPFRKCPNLVLTVCEGSEGEEYAKLWNIPYQYQ